MKRIKIVIFLVIMFVSINVLATAGPIKQDSIILCNGKYYGNHGNPIHWHMVEKKDNTWVSIGKETEVPSCYIKEVNIKEKVFFSKCSDGDTAHFIINNEEKTVRFLAIDTPEITNNEPYSKEASEYTCNALKNAKEIYLEYDSNSDKEDKYGRILAFVHVDGVLLEKSLIEQGLAKVYYIYGDYAHVDELRETESIAKNNKLGIWSDNTPDVVEEEKDNKDEDIIIKIISIIIFIIKEIFALFFN